MKVKPNFKSVVVIGGFNPTILTPDFLKDVCKFNSSHEPLGMTTAVQTEIKYGNTIFLMELNRFQIIVKEVENFDPLFPLDLMLLYLNVLQYTPITLLGVNLNYTLSDVDLAALRMKLTDPYKAATWLGTDVTSVLLSASRQGAEGLLINEVTLVHPIDGDLTNSVKITFGTNDIVINNNFEAGQLEDYRERNGIVADKYAELLGMNANLMNSIAGGVV
jgi:hypothetical protein